MSGAERALGRRAADRLTGLGVGLFVFALLVGSASGYGLTYDEPVYTSRAMRAGQWLGLVLTAPGEACRREVIDRLWDPRGDEQAGLMKLIAWPVAGATQTVLPTLPPLAAVRAGTALVVALLCGLLYVFLAGTLGRLEALFGTVGLLAMPRVFTHCHLMAMDAPVMAWSALAVMAAYLAARQGGARRRCWLWAALLGLAFGAAIATKVNGFFIPAIVLPWLWLYRRRACWAALAGMALLGPLVFLASWPWLWYDTAARLGRYLAFFFRHYPVGVTYFGHVYSVAPWHFAPVMLLITTPVVVLLLAGVGLRQAVARPRRSAESAAGAVAGTDWRRALLALMAWALVCNLLPSCLPSSPKYNGVRLFLPVFVPLVLLAAAGFGGVARRVAARPGTSERERRLVLGLLLVAALAPGLYATAHSYPYGMSYYNLLIGGPRGAMARGMETTYWGDTFLAAVPWLNQHASPGARVWINVPGFVTSMQMYQSFGLMRPDLALVAGEEAFATADFAVVINKPTEYGETGRRLVATAAPAYTAALDGAPLVWVFPGSRGAAP